MRQLQTSDIFAFCRLISAIGMKEEIKTLALKANNVQEIATEEVGFEFLFGMIEKATNAKGEKELYSFFANIFEISVDEIKTMDPVEFMETVTKVADIPKWKAFFKSVASLMK